MPNTTQNKYKIWLSDTLSEYVCSSVFMEITRGGEERYNCIVKDFNSNKIPLKKLDHCTFNIQDILGAGCVVRAGRNVAGGEGADLGEGRTHEA